MFRKIFIITIIFISLLIWFWPKNDLEYISNDYELTPIYVLVEGEVAYPGVYEFYEEIMLKDILNFAVLLETSDITNLDLLRIINKNESIYINKKENKEEVSLKVNINKASFQELLLIPNMTEKRAANIILYREENGPFLQLEDLLNVKYIGSATFEKIKEYIRIE